MSAVAALAPRSDQTARRAHILDAAEACFVRNGFHRTTMQDLAREAAMSPGNFYRYFASKEAIVLGLAERDRERGAVLVAEMEHAQDPCAVLLDILERCLREITREMAVLRVDLWAEASRNPGIAAIVGRGEDEARTWFTATFATLATSPDCAPATLFERIDPVMKGIIVRRAIQADYDVAAGLAQLRALIEAGLAGR